MKRAAKFIALAVIIYLTGLVTLFPASLAIRWFMPATPGLVLGAAEGTVWNGRVSSVEYRGWNIGAADWSLQPLSLLSLAVAADVQLERSGQGPLSASVRMTTDGRIEIRNLQGGITLADLSRAKLMPANIAGGDVILNLQQLDVHEGRPVAANGRAGLAGLTSALLPGVALGSYEGKIETTDAGIIATFSEVDAPLRVAGQAQIGPDGRYSVSGNITPSAETPDALRRGLGLLGQPDASGRYSFSFSGQL